MIRFDGDLDGSRKLAEEALAASRDARQLDGMTWARFVLAETVRQQGDDDGPDEQRRPRAPRLRPRAEGAPPVELLPLAPYRQWVFSFPGGAGGVAVKMSPK